jgi:hypothetical protein
MAPVTRRMGNRFAHLENVNDREEPVREEPPTTYQAHLEAQFVSLGEQIAALTKLLSIGSGRDRRRHIPSLHESEEDNARVENEDGNPFAEARSAHASTPCTSLGQSVGIRFQTRYIGIPRLLSTQRVPCDKKNRKNQQKEGS